MNLKSIVMVAALLGITSSANAQDISGPLVEEDFHIVDTDTSEAFPILGTGIEDFVERYGPPPQTDRAAAPRGATRHVYPGFFVDSSVRSGQVLLVRFLDDSVRTVRGVKIGDSRSVADAAYPVGFYYRTQNDLTGYYSIPDDLFGSKYFLWIQFDESDTVVDIRFGLALNT